jgi:hypothetical protein
MKHLVLGILTTLFLVACGNSTKITLSEEEHAKFSHDQQFIYYEGNPVAKFHNIEYEYYRGHKVMEISLEQLKPGLDDFTDKIVDYVRTKNPKAKVEVKVPFFPMQEEGK